MSTVLTPLSSLLQAPVIAPWNNSNGYMYRLVISPLVLGPTHLERGFALSLETQRLRNVQYPAAFVRRRHYRDIGFSWGPSGSQVHLLHNWVSSSNMRGSPGLNCHSPRSGGNTRLKQKVTVSHWRTTDSTSAPSRILFNTVAASFSNPFLRISQSSSCHRIRNSSSPSMRPRG